MSNQVPIYSHVVPKSQYRASKSSSKAIAVRHENRSQNLVRTDFDPLNYNQGGNFHIINVPIDTRYIGLADKQSTDKRERRSKDEQSRSRRGQNSKNDMNEGKVEAYLRQNQVSMRQQQHRHSAVRQNEHRVNIRSLPLNEVAIAKGHERTPSDRHRCFVDREPNVREHRRERDRDIDAFDTEGLPRTPLSPVTNRMQHDIKEPNQRPVRKSSSAHRVTEPALSTDKRKFFCREWAFQKIAHCLEQRPISKTCGTLILGDAGSGKTALCHELSEPGQGPQARQQRALNRRLLARHYLQATTESSLKPGEFIRSLAMQILSHSSQHRQNRDTPGKETYSSYANKEGAEPESPDNLRSLLVEDRFTRRLQDLGDDGEDSSKPLLGDSEDQRTDEDEAVPQRYRTVDRIHERETYSDLLSPVACDVTDAQLSRADELPEILPRHCLKQITTNPFLPKETARDNSEFRVYENHENLFLRNISQRQSKELRNSRLIRQNSEPSSEKRTNILQKSLSTEQRNDSASSESEQRDCRASEKNTKSSVEHSSPPNAKISRIPVANFKYPNKSDLRSSSNENSPLKINKHTSNDSSSDKDKRDDKDKTDDKDKQTQKLADETPEYQNILKPESLLIDFDKELKDEVKTPDLERLLEKKRSQNDDIPPPIPCLPITPRTLIANAYYDKILSEPDIQQALLPHNLEKNPDECFKKALLFPLLEIDPPKQCLFLLVDSIDEGSLTGPLNLNSGNRENEGRNINSSRTVAELLANHHHLFPQWLLLVCTARKQSKSLTKMFTGFRKIALDELHRAHVSADVQRYVLARLDTEPRLRARVSSDATAAAAAAAALDHLRIKSDGCLLYLEKVLDGVADGFIALREIKEIPGTLNGLYLWLAQRLFHGRRFAKVRLLLDVLLAAKCGVSEEMLYKCLLTKEYSVSREDFNRRLHLLRRILVIEHSTSFLTIFHHSFASWLLDVKHCTRRYLCSPAEGHAALAMYYTLEAKRLSALEIHNYVLHMTHLEQHLTLQKKNKSGNTNEVSASLDLHTLMLLWVLDSSCDIEMALRKEMDGFKNEVCKEEAIEEGNETDQESAQADIKQQSSETGETAPQIETLMPEIMNGLETHQWPQDEQVLRALLELTKSNTEVESTVEDTLPNDTNAELNCLISLDQNTESEDYNEPSVDEQIETTLLDPTSAHELATRGDDETLQLLLKTYPHLAECMDATGGTPLHAAARHGKAACAAILLKAGSRPDAADGDGWTPLRAAAWAGHTEVVEVLLEFGCQVDCVDGDNRTALRAAAWSGHEAVVSRLLAAGASPDRPDAEGRTPLIAAAYMGHADIVRALLDAGAEVDHADEDGRTALSVASLCASGTACAHLLLERGADVTKSDRDRATPLLVAAFEGHTEICELLLEHEADAESGDAAGRTALWAAASAGHADTVRLLLFWGACVDNMDAEGRTVLSAAAAQGNVEVVRQLLDRGLDEHHRDNSGWTPLHYAAFEGHVEVCEALLEAGAKVDEADNDGKGPLMLAAQEGHTKLIEILIDEWGAPVDQHAHDGKTALRLAALEGHFDAVRTLYERSADVDSLDADRRSTLYVLALDNRLAMARYFLRDCGASVDTRDAEGRTPLHVSAWQGHTDMVNLLIKVGGAQVDGRDRCARTALHAAAWRGRATVLRALLQHGASAAAVCTQGATPLGIAAQEGHEECVLWLLQHGADPMQADHCGRTPAKVAWRAGHANICRLLERWVTPSAPVADETSSIQEKSIQPLKSSPEYKRRSIHSSNSTKSSSNLTGGSGRSHEASGDIQPDVAQSTEKSNRAHLSLSFAQQVARCGRVNRRERQRDGAIPEHQVVEKDSKMSRSYAANERDADIRGYVRERDKWRDARHFMREHVRQEREVIGYSYERENMSPLYASPPRSPISDICSPTQPTAPIDAIQQTSQAASQPTVTDQHFNRDTHMRIILGRDSKPPVERNESKNKRNGIVTNPAMRLVANVRNGLDNAAANIRRTGVALAASASSANPAVKTSAFQWRRETPL